MIESMTMSEMFEDWVDYDIAMYYLACLLGMMKYDDTFDEFKRGYLIQKTKCRICFFSYWKEWFRAEYWRKSKISGIVRIRPLPEITIGK